MADSTQTLRFVLFGDDRASSAFSRASRSVDDMRRALDRSNLVSDEAKRKFDQIGAKAAELGRLNPAIRVDVETAAARLKLDLFRRDLNSTLNDTSGSNVPGLFTRILGSSGGAGGAGASGLLGVQTTLPVIGAAGPQALGALAVAAVGAGVALAPVAAALIPVTIGFGGLALIAKNTLSPVFTALGEHGKALAKTWKTMSEQQKDLYNQALPLKKSFGDLAQSVKPEIYKAFSTGLRIIKDLMPALKPLVVAAGKALDTFLKHMSDWLSSPQGQSFIHWLKTVGPQDIKNFGRVMWDIAHGVGDALHFIYSAGSWVDRFLTRWGDDWKLVTATAREQWDQIKSGALKLVFDVLGAFTHIPFIGQEFRRARADISTELGRIQADNVKAVNAVQSAWDSIHGRTVALTFGLNLPPGVSYPSRPIKGHKAAGGGVGSSGVYVVGEQGPELAWLPSGSHVTPAAPTRRILGGLAAGTSGWDFTEAFRPSPGVFGRALTSAAAADENAITRFVQAHAQYAAGLGGGSAGAGPGVARWAGVVRQALGLLGLPSGDAGTILSQMTTESGGDPVIVNKWDSNWAAGTPSVGLMQVIGPTFAAYAGPFRNTGPFEYGTSVNPLANVYAGVNYAIHRYGNPGFLSVLGHGHGYDSGGWLPTGWSAAYNGTGRPEQVIPHSGRGGAAVVNHVTVQVGHGTSPVQAAKEIADILNHGARAGIRVRKSLVSTSG